MGMQLTETLHGILPIAPTEDFHKDDNTNAINVQNNKNVVGFHETYEIYDAAFNLVFNTAY